MGTILLRLAGPLQSWGSESRFTERKTRHEPTKSGVVGLLAAALGRTREQSVDDLASLPMAVRVDQPGQYERDFQTAHTRKYDKAERRWVFNKSLPLSNRYYLSDAVFVAGIEGPGEMLAELADALNAPSFPLYLGRRSCSPSGRVLIGVCDDLDLMDAMAQHPWEATARGRIYQNRNNKTVLCEVLRDLLPNDDEVAPRETVRDYPMSFSQEHRLYDWRTIVHEQAEVVNPHCVSGWQQVAHDPMAALGEV